MRFSPLHRFAVPLPRKRGRKEVRTRIGAPAQNSDVSTEEDQAQGVSGVNMPLPKNAGFR